MFANKEPEVLVVGAGPVGLFAGLLLAENDIRVEIIDQQWRTAAHSYALALHPATLAMLSEHGLTQELVERGHRVARVGFYQGDECRARVAFADLRGHFPFLLILPQDALEGALEDRLRKKGVKVRWNHRVGHFDPDAAALTVRVDQLAKEASGYSVAHTGWVIDKSFESRPAFLVGTDGQHSAVRRNLGGAWDRQGPSQMFAVFEFETGQDSGDEVKVVLTDDSTNVLWPLSGGRRRWNFQLPGDESVEPRAKNPLAVQIRDQTYPYLSRERLAALIDERAPWFTTPIGEVVWSLGVRFERRLVDHFGRGRVWLAGDAAHLAAPIGVCSMNVGMREARDLVERITAVLRDGATPESLAAFDAQRLSEWRRILGVERRVSTASGADPWVKVHAERIVDCVPSAGADLDQLLRSIGIELA